MSRSFLSTLFGAILFCLAPSVASAQLVRGAVVDSATGRAVSDFTVQLIDDRGASVAAALGLAGGRFALAAPVAGSYRLRVLRIGFRRTETALFPLGSGETIERRIAMPQISVSLSRIRVVGPQRCEGLPTGGEALATVWEEVRKAVQAVALTGEEGRLFMRVRDYTRDISLRGDSASREESSEREGLSAHPYVSPTPASIARDGYVRQQADGLWYYAPDADVLLSNSFVNAHCFHLQRDASDADSTIGIAFEPVRRRPPPDIRGVLRVDRRSAELRELEYEYTALPSAVGDRKFGGRVTFQHVPGAGWIIRRWVVRGPVIGTVRRQQLSSGGLVMRGIGATTPVLDSVLAGVHEGGGEVLVARTLAGVTAWASSYTVVSGSVSDSAGRTGIAGAFVELRGTAHRARTDSTGAFRIDSVPPGDYTLAASVRAPASIVRSAAIRVADRPVRVDFNLPAKEAVEADARREREMLASRCTELRRAREREIDSTFAVPADRWQPGRGSDSLEIARAIRQSAVVLQAIADTTGRVDIRSVRVLKRRSNSAYAAARDALAKLEPPVDEPVPGCKLRRLILLPYRLYEP